jgi:phosphohistidine swiveling domain-containing protein
MPPGEYILGEYKNDLMYVYFDQSSLRWTKDELMKRVASDENFVAYICDKSREHIAPILGLLKKPRALISAEFKEYLKHLATAWSYLAAMWWLIEEMEERGGYEKELELLMKLRKDTEVFAPGIDIVNRKTLEERYPDFKKDIVLISINEFLEDKKISQEMLDERRKYSFIDSDGFFSGSAAVSRAKRYDLIQPSTSGEIKGTVAYRGIYKGVVKIVLRDEDTKKVEKGDVMVSSTTIPPWIDAIERSGAIITDEGGILSHASIVSRELKKPCIIGTKNATHVLKDGDIVEVDAEKGIVKILK